LKNLLSFVSGLYQSLDRLFNSFVGMSSEHTKKLSIDCETLGALIQSGIERFLCEYSNVLLELLVFATHMVLTIKEFSVGLGH